MYRYLQCLVEQNCSNAHYCTKHTHRNGWTVSSLSLLLHFVLWAFTREHLRHIFWKSCSAVPGTVHERLVAWIACLRSFYSSICLRMIPFADKSLRKNCKVQNVWTQTTIYKSCKNCWRQTAWYHLVLPSYYRCEIGMSHFSLPSARHGHSLTLISWPWYGVFRRYKWHSTPVPQVGLCHDHVPMLRSVFGHAPC